MALASADHAESDVPGGRLYLGLASQALFVTGRPGCDALRDCSRPGVALSADLTLERGRFFLRDRRWRRSSIGLRWTVPLFDKDDPYNPPRYPWRPFSFLSLVLRAAL